MEDSTMITKHESIVIEAKNEKQGYCYIGYDNGRRLCMKVGNSDKCMSGEIFPTHDICINPNLRE